MVRVHITVLSVIVTFATCYLNGLNFISSRKNKMKELVSNSTTSISQARKAVEQLKMEAYMDRMKVNLDLLLIF